MPPAHPLDRADAVAAPRQVGLLPTLCLDGAWQMAIDEQLLEMVLADPKARPVLRLYRWSRPTLSVGHHQHHLPQHWLTLASAGAVDLVRRPSGGRAVLHGGDLSYALIWPAAPSQRRKAYGKACGWLCHAFAQFGMPLRFGRRAPSREQPNCFAVSTSADLVHRDGSKRIGSAQLWRRGALLQHGSIMLAPPVDLWRQLFDEPPPCLPKLPFGAEEIGRAHV